MTKYVGIVGINGSGPLYCQEDEDDYHVINGAWSFTKDGLVSPPYDDPYCMPYRVVIPDMGYFEDYNEACDIIEKQYKEGIWEVKGLTQEQYDKKVHSESLENIEQLSDYKLIDIAMRKNVISEGAMDDIKRSVTELSKTDKQTALEINDFIKSVKSHKKYLDNIDPDDMIPF